MKIDLRQIVQRNQSLFNSLAAYTGMGIAFVNKILLYPRYLADAGQVGLLNVMYEVANLFANLASWGFANIILRYFPIFQDRSKGHKGFLFFAALVVHLVFLLISGVYLLFRPQISAFYTKSPLLITYYTELIFLALGILWTLVLEAYLRSLYRSVFPSFIRDVYLKVFQTLAVLAYAFDWIDFSQLILCTILIQGSVGLILLAYTYYLGELHLRPVWSREIGRLYKNMLNYGGFLVLGNISMLLVMVIDALMVSGMVGASASDIYTTMANILLIMVVPSRSLFKVVYPKIARYWRLRSLRAIGIAYTGVTSNNVFFATLIMLGILLNFPLVVHSMQPIYAEGFEVLTILAFAKWVDIVTGLNGMILITSKQYKLDLLFSLGMVLLAFVSNLWLIPQVGIAGAAWATLLTSIVYNALRTAYIYYAYKLQPFLWSHGMIALIGLGLFVLVSSLPETGQVVADVLIRSLLCTLLYVGSIYGLKLYPALNRKINKMRYAAQHKRVG